MIGNACGEFPRSFSLETINRRSNIPKVANDQMIFNDAPGLSVGCVCANHPHRDVPVRLARTVRLDAISFIDKSPHCRRNKP
jgi:hypothetical protein